MSILTFPFTVLGNFFTGVANARHYEALFAMSDAELATRGLNRDKLVRGFITGFAHG